MKCGCEICGAFMVHVEKGEDSYCVCPECMHQCKDCMGGDNPRFAFLDRDTVRRMKKDADK
ncbi:MAG: hypothetical protein JXN65_09370 [Clostridia bacterium]|nr:hypothetical protein [Clostridia bacterium]